ncbi:MAG: aminopeptidase P family N-terminal domain-containing protein [Candidatus Limnocylindrales bacterium]
MSRTPPSERSAARRARLDWVDLPFFGPPSDEPILGSATYASRIKHLRALMDEANLDRLLVYADREHSANISYLSGFDPRFEEALLVVGGAGVPDVLVGNENRGTAGAAPLPMRTQMFQDFSLPGQPRDKSRPLTEILADAGIGPKSRVGVVGWKEYAQPWMSDVPAYLIDTVRGLAGPDNVSNQTGLLIDASAGMRVINEPEQLAYLEWAACHVSDGVRNLLWNVRPGMTEHDAVALLRWNGTPLSCHLMLTAGPRAKLGLLSPSDRRIARTDTFTTAYGIWGALTCRAGFMVEDARELPRPVRNYVDRLVAPYFEAVAEWLEALHIGQTGGALYEISARRLGDPFFGIFLNPGHQISLDEWVNSPVWPGSEVELRSGMAMQVDIIPATGTDYFTSNMEDGVALADAPLRAQLAERFPQMWRRMTERRTFMARSLGIELHPDVLPLSNLTGYLPPFILQPGRALTLA